MSEREELAQTIARVAHQREINAFLAADAVLASPWLRAHDDRIRAEALAPVLALADEWERWAYVPVPSLTAGHAAARLRAAAGTPTHDNQKEDA